MSWEVADLGWPSASHFPGTESGKSDWADPESRIVCSHPFFFLTWTSSFTLYKSVKTRVKPVSRGERDWHLCLYVFDSNLYSSQLLGTVFRALKDDDSSELEKTKVRKMCSPRLEGLRKDYVAMKTKWISFREWRRVLESGGWLVTCPKER